MDFKKSCDNVKAELKREGRDLLASGVKLVHYRYSES